MMPPRKRAGTAPADPAAGTAPADPSTSASRSAPKVRRWVDLLAALLVRHYPATFSELAEDVPAYRESAKAESARMRMFERDKDELRAFGVPIESVTMEGDDGPRGAYRLARRDFYLPYLHLVSPQGEPGSAPRRIDRYGYQALMTLAFEPDELAAVVAAAVRVRTLGDPFLAGESESAMRKLAADLPVDAASHADDTTILRTNATPPAELFELVSDALARRKVLEFDYHAMSTDRSERRTLEPYGLFFVGAHWYLAGRDRDRGELRNFRLNRMSAPDVNERQPQTSDYEIPATFYLREHARSRNAWELGDGDATAAVVEFCDQTGVTAAAARLGAPVEGAPSRRQFQVRRGEPFARWLLSFGGDVVPISPPSLVELYADHVRQTLALYRDDAPITDAAGAEP